MDQLRLAVFFTPELLNIILLHCDPLDLLRLQRVCRRFRDSIVSTRTIRRQLFLEADPSCLIVNDGASEDGDAWEKITPNNGWSAVRPNPLVVRIFRSPSDRMGYSISGETIYEKWSIENQLARWDEQKFLLVHLLQETKSSGSWSDTSASWRSMTFTQPPITHVAVFMASPRYAGEEYPRSPDFRIVSDRQGVRLGDIVDHIRARATTPFLEGAPLAIAVLNLARFERIYSACYHAFSRYKISFPSTHS
ncbi:hypothetical protein, variant [Verruconis gallopava]|uniref:F-box domain-containing protein n=1 Tax=Verruconis gallopava TaxID=253628 RepID=A0A0D1ZYG2_9PEZI|nr:uncharacterized protein PV09_08892 [Verruconis gallopava]XP_016209342.1 hypothetical protein, variant [Verruconis gallopava]KIV99471.1 hypothetical protein PV09_08892 [Verruconis gallopava]KIV99472.1 hypothetical protein, variant [Verruconis gallopava]